MFTKLDRQCLFSQHKEDVKNAEQYEYEEYFHDKFPRT